MTTTTIPVRTQADALGLLQETVEFYGNNPETRRASVLDSQGSERCVYVSADGRKCAVGRCLIQPSSIQQPSGRGLAVADIAKLKGDRFQSLFKPEYQGYPIEIWNALQRLHDSEKHWSQTGLSPLGELAKTDLENWIRNKSGLSA